MGWNWNPSTADGEGILEKLIAEHLENIVLNALEDDPTRDLTRLRGFQAYVLLRHFLGSEWSDECLQPGRTGVRPGNRPGRQFFRTDATSVEDRFRHQERVERLAELLYNLQDLDGVAERHRGIQQGDVESTYAELEFAGYFITRGVGVRLINRSGMKGSDYDFEASVGLESVCCEVKCKLESTDLGENTIINSLNHARKQAPKDRAAIIGVKIPEAWSTKPTLKSHFESALAEFFRTSGRIVAVAVRWEEVISLQSGPGMILYRFAAFPNEAARNSTDEVRRLVARLQQPPTGAWTSLYAAVLRYLPTSQAEPGAALDTAE